MYSVSVWAQSWKDRLKIDSSIQTLTYCIKLCLVARCDQTAREAFERLRTPSAPTVIYNRTTTVERKFSFWVRIGPQFNCLKGFILLTCSTHRFVVIIWFFRFWNENGNIY